MSVTVSASKTLLLCLLAAILALGTGLVIWAQSSRPITLAWDAMPAGEKWASVRIYEITNPASPVMVAETQCTIGPPIVCPTEVTFTMSRATHTYTARAWDGFWESGDSNSVTVPTPANPPTGLKKK
jgi:hypothetical protein